MVTISAILAAAGSWRTTCVGMVAIYSAISRASSRSFLARAQAGAASQLPKSVGLAAGGEQGAEDAALVAAGLALSARRLDEL